MLPYLMDFLNSPEEFVCTWRNDELSIEPIKPVSAQAAPKPEPHLEDCDGVPGLQPGQRHHELVALIKTQGFEVEVRKPLFDYYFMKFGELWARRL